VPGVDRREVPGFDRREISGFDRREVPGFDRREVPGVDRREVPGVDRREVPGVDRREVPGVDRRRGHQRDLGPQHVHQNKSFNRGGSHHHDRRQRTPSPEAATTHGARRSQVATKASVSGPPSRSSRSPHRSQADAVESRHRVPETPAHFFVMTELADWLRSLEPKTNG
jgi:hypothetical protein